MSGALPTVETDRLAKLIRLIFSTDKTCEAVAAIAAVKCILTSENVDAHWLADRFTEPIALPRADKREERSEQSDAWFAFHHRHLLSPKERAFVENIFEWSAPLSDKQRRWFWDIIAKLEREAAWTRR
jgi:hypothetical protein